MFLFFTEELLLKFLYFTEELWVEFGDKHIDLQYVAGAVTGAMTQWRMLAPSIRRFILMRMAPINIGSTQNSEFEFENWTSALDMSYYSSYYYYYSSSYLLKNQSLYWELELQTLYTT